MSCAIRKLMWPMLAPEHRNFRQENDERYIWLVVDPDDEYTLKMDGQAADDLTEKEAAHDWLEYEVDMIGWLDLVGGESIEDLLLTEGIAPGQPFLVWFKPHYYRSYEGDHEMDVDVEILYVLPQSAAVHAVAWEKWIKDGYPDQQVSPVVRGAA